ncbi:uncharacterized protein LOC126904536 [Daktulosphaira vitifoliae]|uniref:uncharacterized protein LOC126904536 n=1 Tax=Daktulosphaira vitifoliae TaxID=58002 RepID=UPI0021AA3C29|nr:uncharacterized protein LOC126904536 [Daktulosphaira vitifoliae]XP_050539589.1 uncharacterized protein LOC126904536 [Daktulosphaira vitifoliae]
MKYYKVLLLMFGHIVHDTCCTENVQVTYHGFNNKNNNIVDQAKEESKNGYYAPEYDHGEYAHPAYRFEYGVHDPHTGDIKKQYEERDGDTVRGYYSLMEPDGTIRLVEYTADSKNGFQAVVKKIGNSHHPTTVTHHLNNGPVEQGGYAPQYHGQNYHQPATHYKPSTPHHYETAHYQTPPNYNPYEQPVTPPVYHHQIPVQHSTYYHPSADVVNYAEGSNFADYDVGYANTHTSHADYGSVPPHQYDSSPLRFPAHTVPIPQVSNDHFEWPSVEKTEEFKYPNDLGSGKSQKLQTYERPEYLRKYFEPEFKGPGNYFEELE